MPTLTPRHGYYKIDDDLPGWHYWMNANLEIFNAVGKRLMALRDVDTLVLKNKSILKYNSSTSKWEVVIKRT
jgi:hypothetical protein